MTDGLTTDTAGAGSPAPAVSSSAPVVGAGGADIVPHDARVELDRIRRRWGELPLSRAEDRMPVLRHLLADLAPRTAALPATRPEEQLPSPLTGAAGPLPVVPDLGPAVVVDQLTVLVWDAYANGRGDGIPLLLGTARRELG